MTHASITSLNIHPIKSCRAIPLERASLAVTGLAGDRQWMVVTLAGRFLTQREVPRLALIGITVGEPELRIDAPEMPALTVPAQLAGESHPVTVWKDQCAARDAGDEPAEWFTRALSRPVRLVQFDASVPRPSNVEWTQGIEALNGFTDGFPVLVISEASLDDLNSRLATPLPMDRFRPNVVLSGLNAYDEDRIHELVAGEVRLRIVKPCTRCVITTTDQATAQVVGPEPLRTLRSYRWNAQLQGVAFGQNVIVASGVGEELHVGQQLEVIWK